MPVGRQQFNIVLFFALLTTHISLGQDSASLKEIAWLKEATQKAFSFDTSIYKQIQAEFYLVVIDCENKRIKQVNIRDQDTGYLKPILLTNLRQHLNGHIFQSYYIPKTILIPIALMNPLNSSYVNFDFDRMARLFSYDDTSLTKSIWQIEAIYYYGSIDRWKRTWPW